MERNRDLCRRERELIGYTSRVAVFRMKETKITNTGYVVVPALRRRG